jgi:LysM domain
MGVAIAGGHRLIPGQRAGDSDLRPRLYLVPPLSDVGPDSEPEVDTDGAGQPSAFNTPAVDAEWEEPIAYRLSRREPTSSRRRPVRLTRRGRVVVTLLLFVIVAGVALLLATASQASAPAGPMRTVVVEPGDTLWSISVEALPSEDPYQAVDQVRRLNHMDADTVFVGQQLTLPPVG